MNFPIEKYRYIKNGKTVIAISSYAGKTIKGIAKCDPRDEFDPEYGKRLAAARCNAKVCERRKKNAERKLLAARDELERAKVRYEEMERYYGDACHKSYLAKKDLSDM